MKIVQFLKPPKDRGKELLKRKRDSIDHPITYPPTNSFAPFWSPLCHQISSNLYSAIKRESSPFSYPLHPCLEQKSWFSVCQTIPKTPVAFPSEYFLSISDDIAERQKILEKKEPDKKKPKKAQAVKKPPKLKNNGEPHKPRTKSEPKPTFDMKSRRVRIYPNVDEKRTLDGWFGTFRWIYNQCLDGIKNHSIENNEESLREYCIYEKSPIFQANTWLKNTPQCIRDDAMRDLKKAYNSSFSLSKTTGNPFQIKFKSKKDRSDCIPIGSRFYNTKKGDGSFIRKIRSSEELPATLEHDSRITKDKENRYWLCIPTPITEELLFKNQEDYPHRMGKVCSIDPGVRTFATIYGSDGRMIEIGKGSIGRLVKMSIALDKLHSKCDQKETRHRKRYKYKKAMRRIHRRVKDLVRELHLKLAKFLCSSYQIILLPSFNSQHMTNKLKRKITSKTARQMLTWSHFSFQQFLLHKVREYVDVKVRIVTEEYTSQTCSHCGELNKKIGGKKKFKCPSCKSWMDRDLNASKNILIKNIQESYGACKRSHHNIGTHTLSLGNVEPINLDNLDILTGF
jgi:putative transposase